MILTGIGFVCPGEEYLVTNLLKLGQSHISENYFLAHAVQDYRRLPIEQQCGKLKFEKLDDTSPLKVGDFYTTERLTPTRYQKVIDFKYGGMVVANGYRTNESNHHQLTQFPHSIPIPEVDGNKLWKIRDPMNVTLKQEYHKLIDSTPSFQYERRIVNP